MIRTLATMLLLGLISARALGSPSIRLEIATERGVQITAPHEWLQLLTSIGIRDVRIRSARSTEQARIEEVGSPGAKSFDVVGLLTSRNELRLPGGTFTRADRARLKDYFDRLGADGAASLTAPRGMFGLAEQEIEAVFADLSQPIGFDTKGLAPRALVERLDQRLALRLLPDDAALLGDAEPIADEVGSLTVGTGLAIVLRSYGLMLRPEKERGQPIVLRITRMPDERLVNHRAGTSDDHDMARWPVGWEPEVAPGSAAPELFEYLNAEIDGYTLEESLGAIAPRLEIPILLDHACLQAEGIDPSNIQVRMARTRTYYKRVIDRILSQARLGSDVRVDEAGTPFLWITR